MVYFILVGLLLKTASGVVPQVIGTAAKLGVVAAVHISVAAPPPTVSLLHYLK